MEVSPSLAIAPKPEFTSRSVRGSSTTVPQASPVPRNVFFIGREERRREGRRVEGSSEK